MKSSLPEAVKKSVLLNSLNDDMRDRLLRDAIRRSYAAAALSAESAEADRVAAEAARDEAQDLANVGYASESHAGLSKVDGKTTQADAGLEVDQDGIQVAGLICAMHTLP